jgi:hypothetical protein
MMANIRLLVAIFAYFTRLLEATKIEFNRAGVIDADLGERLFFNCSATSDHVIDLLEIGQDHTIDEKLSYDPSQPGTPVTRYEPEGCTFSEEGSQCSKVINITVTEDMVGKAYQCRSFRREYENHMTYSKGGYVQVKQLSISPPTPTPTSPPATAICKRVCDHSGLLHL